MLRRPYSVAMSETELECPICYEVSDGVVHQCHEGHCFCAACDTQIADRLCPICREPLPGRPIRSRALERQIAGLPAACAHCGAATTRGEKEAHEAACPQRPRACAAAELGCAWRGLVGAQPAHEAACAYVECQRVVAPLRAEAAALRALRAEVAELRPLRAENERLRARVAELEEAGEVDGRRQRQRVGPAPHDAPPTDAAIGQMGVAEAAAALRAYVADARVARVACMRIVSLCRDHRPNLQPAAEAGAMEAAVAAMRAHPQAASVLIAASQALNQMAGGNEAAAFALKQRAAEAGALGGDGGTDPSPACDARPQLLGVAVLGVLCGGTDAAGLARKERAAQAGAIEATVEVMRAHPAENAQRLGVALLRCLCFGQEAAGQARRERAAQAGAIEAATAALRAHPSLEGLQDHACSCLATLCAGIDGVDRLRLQQRVADEGAIEAAAAALRAHPQVERVQLSGCMLLYNLGTGGGAAAQAAHGGGGREGARGARRGRVPSERANPAVGATDDRSALSVTDRRRDGDRSTQTRMSLKRNASSRGTLTKLVDAGDRGRRHRVPRHDRLRLAHEGGQRGEDGLRDLRHRHLRRLRLRHRRRHFVHRIAQPADAAAPLLADRGRHVAVALRLQLRLHPPPVLVVGSARADAAEHADRLARVKAPSCFVCGLASHHGSSLSHHGRCSHHHGAWTRPGNLASSSTCVAPVGSPPPPELSALEGPARRRLERGAEGAPPPIVGVRAAPAPQRRRRRRRVLLRRRRQRLAARPARHHRPPARQLEEVAPGRRVAGRRGGGAGGGGEDGEERGGLASVSALFSACARARGYAARSLAKRRSAELRAATRREMGAVRAFAHSSRRRPRAHDAPRDGAVDRRRPPPPCRPPRPDERRVRAVSALHGVEKRVSEGHRWVAWDGARPTIAGLARPNEAPQRS